MLGKDDRPFGSKDSAWFGVDWKNVGKYCSVPFSEISGTIWIQTRVFQKICNAEDISNRFLFKLLFFTYRFQQRNKSVNWNFPFLYIIQEL